MILRNHGLLTAGRTIPEAFGLMFDLNRACEVQLGARTTGQFERGGVLPGHRQWPALLRRLDRECPEYTS